MKKNVKKGKEKPKYKARREKQVENSKILF